MAYQLTIRLADGSLIHQTVDAPDAYRAAHAAAERQLTLPPRARIIAIRPA